MDEKKANIKYVVLFSLLTLGFFGAWFATGFAFPTTWVPYFLNGGSRIASQVAIALSVAPAKQGLASSSQKIT